MGSHQREEKAAEGRDEVVGGSAVDESEVQESDEPESKRLRSETLSVVKKKPDAKVSRADLADADDDPPGLLPLL